MTETKNHRHPAASQLTEAEHQDAVAQSRADRDQTLAAIHALDHALATAAPGREQLWLQEVLSCLRTLEDALSGQGARGDDADGLLTDIAQMEPRFEIRVRQLREQLADIRRTAASLRSQMAESADFHPDYADIRQQLNWMLTKLRHYRARETDLIFEAYNLDIGQGD